MEKNLMQMETDIIPYRDNKGNINTIPSGRVAVDGYEEKNVIPTNQYAREMRMAMENKNLLQRAGSLYVGTGSTQEVTPFEGAEWTVAVPITAPLNPPTVDGNYVLTCVVTLGKATLAWKKQ